MHKRQRIYSVFIFVLSLSLLLFVLSNSPFTRMTQGLAETIVKPVQQGFYYIFGYSIFVNRDEELKKLKEDRERLVKQLIEQESLKKENRALRDQFAAQLVSSPQLLPAAIVGLRAFAVGGEPPTSFVIDKGAIDNVAVGSAVIYKDILIGTVSKVSPQFALVSTTAHDTTSIPIYTLKTNALGILKGYEKRMIIDNVVLSDKLEKNDIVVSKGNLREDGTGYPADLAIGKIASIQKKPSALFQTAEIEPLVNITQLSTVFIYLGEK